MSSSSEPAPGVHGLTTPQLKGGELTDASSASHTEATDGDTIFDTTLAIEAKLRGMLEQIDANDTDFSTRAAALADKIAKLQKDLN